MTDWKIYQGNQANPLKPGELKLPDAPSWRPSGRKVASPSGATAAQARSEEKAKTFRPRPQDIELVNAALYLRRPLLVTGPPGVGKSSLVYSVAHQLGLGEVLYWPVTTRTTLQDGLYGYDAIGRLQEPKSGESKSGELKSGEPDNLANIGKYIQLGALGTALLPAQQPRVLLIDEIDKGDIDLPNDLLCVFEEGGFNIRELTRIKDKLPEGAHVQTSYTYGHETTFKVPAGRVDCDAFPFIVMTSNGERDFPAPFLRRCIRLTMHEPDQDELTRIVEAHLKQEATPAIAMLIDEFYARRDELREKGNLATDQLLNAVYLVTQGQVLDAAGRERLLEQLWKPLNSSEDA
jgi:MoxR-like ATPase